MNARTEAAREAARYELRFQSLFTEGRAMSFACDAEGHVDLDAMTEKAKLNYLYARTLIGRDFACPAVRVVH